MRCTFWCSRDAHRPACISAGAATSCGLAARSAVAQEPLGAWRVATPGAQVPGSGAGPGLLAHPRPRPRLGSLPLEIIPAGRRRSTPSPFSDDGAGRRPAALAAALPTGRIGCRLELGMRRGDGRADVARGRGRRPWRCRAAADRVSVAPRGASGFRATTRRRPSAVRLRTVLPALAH